jgi:hypothetical protein
VKRLIGALAGLVLLVVMLVVPPMQLWDRMAWRADYGTWEATSQPPRFDFCGHHFYPDGSRHTLAFIRAYVVSEQKRTPGIRWTGLHKVGETPAGTVVLADSPNGECGAAEVFVNIAPGTYEVYAGDTGG